MDETTQLEQLNCASNEAFAFCRSRGTSMTEIDESEADELGLEI
jgi:hypothetical protein